MQLVSSGWGNINQHFIIPLARRFTQCVLYLADLAQRFYNFQMPVWKLMLTYAFFSMTYYSVTGQLYIGFFLNASALSQYYMITGSNLLYRAWCMLLFIHWGRVANRAILRYFLWFLAFASGQMLLQSSVVLLGLMSAHITPADVKGFREDLNAYNEMVKMSLNP